MPCPEGLGCAPSRVGADPAGGGAWGCERRFERMTDEEQIRRVLALSMQYADDRGARGGSDPYADDANTTRRLARSLDARRSTSRSRAAPCRRPGIARRSTCAATR